MIAHSETLCRFVLRARRLEAHSLASDRQALLLLSELTLTGHIGLDGTMEMRRALPDEEVFESLAARVRPLLVTTESVHHSKVLAAVQVCIDATELEVPEDLLRRSTDLREEWSKFDLESSTVQRFAVQSARADGSGATPLVSDTQLAGAFTVIWSMSTRVGPRARVFDFRSGSVTPLRSPTSHMLSCSA